jgi:hypothetical protein
MSFKRISFLFGFMLIVCVILIACQPTPTLVVPSTSGIGVGITKDDSCPNVLVQPGQQVIWTNQDDYDHIVRDKPAEGKGTFDSGTLHTGDSFTYTFMNSGSYPYECSEDGSMTGMITVQP